MNHFVCCMQEFHSRLHLHKCHTINVQLHCQEFKHAVDFESKIKKFKGKQS